MYLEIFLTRLMPFLNSDFEFFYLHPQILTKNFTHVPVRFCNIQADKRVKAKMLGNGIKGSKGGWQQKIYIHRPKLPKLRHPTIYRILVEKQCLHPVGAGTGCNIMIWIWKFNFRNIYGSLKDLALQQGCMESIRFFIVSQLKKCNGLFQDGSSNKQEYM